MAESLPKYANELQVHIFNMPLFSSTQIEFDNLIIIKQKGDVSNIYFQFIEYIIRKTCNCVCNKFINLNGMKLI